MPAICGPFVVVDRLGTGRCERRTADGRNGLATDREERTYVRSTREGAAPIQGFTERVSAWGVWGNGPGRGAAPHYPGWWRPNRHRDAPRWARAALTRPPPPRERRLGLTLGHALRLRRQSVAEAGTEKLWVRALHISDGLVEIAVDNLPGISHDDPARPLNVDRQA